MEYENLNTPQNPPLQQTAVRRSAFIVTIDDGYCKWEFGFNPENADNLCVEDILKVLENHFKPKMAKENESRN